MLGAMFAGVGWRRLAVKAGLTFAAVGRGARARKSLSTPERSASASGWQSSPDVRSRSCVCVGGGGMGGWSTSAAEAMREERGRGREGVRLAGGDE